MAKRRPPCGMISAKVFSAENYRCQKCLEKGHFTYECTGKRKYVSRPNHTALLQKKLKTEEKVETDNGVEKRGEISEQLDDVSAEKKEQSSSEDTDDSASEDSESDSSSSSSCSSSNSSSGSCSNSNSRSSSGSSSNSSSGSSSEDNSS